MLTRDPENVSNVWDEDDQHVDDKEQTHGDGNVPQPVEGPLWKQQLQEGPTDLEEHRGRSAMRRRHTAKDLPLQALHGSST